MDRDGDAARHRCCRVRCQYGAAPNRQRPQSRANRISPQPRVRSFCRRQRPGSAPIFATTYVEALHADYPRLATTQPLSVPLDLPQAAHLLLHQWVTVSGPPGEDLWITDPRARPIDQVLAEAIDPQAEPQAHVTQERVMFVHWMPVDNGSWPPYLICRTR